MLMLIPLARYNTARKGLPVTELKLQLNQQYDSKDKSTLPASGYMVCCFAQTAPDTSSEDLVLCMLGQDMGRFHRLHRSFSTSWLPPFASAAT